MKYLAFAFAAIAMSTAQAAEQPRPFGCDAFAMTGIPYAGNPPKTCDNHDDHFRSMTKADWEMLAGEGPSIARSLGTAKGQCRNAKGEFARC